MKRIKGKLFVTEVSGYRDDVWRFKVVKMVNLTNYRIGETLEKKLIDSAIAHDNVDVTITAAK